MEEVKKILRNFQNESYLHIKNKLNRLEHQLNQAKNSFTLKNPSMLYEGKIQKLDYLNEQLSQVLKHFLKQKQNKLDQLKSAYILKNPLLLYQNHQKNLNHLTNQLELCMKHILEQKEHTLALKLNTLKLLNPLNLLEKGYSLISKDDILIKSCKELSKNDKIKIQMEDGSILASVKEVI